MYEAKPCLHVREESLTADIYKNVEIHSSKKVRQETGLTSTTAETTTVEIMQICDKSQPCSSTSAQIQRQ